MPQLGPSGQTRPFSLAEILLQAGISGQTRTPLEGIGNLARSLAGVYVKNKEDAAREAALDETSTDLASIMSGFGKGIPGVEPAPFVTEAERQPKPGGNLEALAYHMTGKHRDAQRAVVPLAMQLAAQENRPKARLLSPDEMAAAGFREGSVVSHGPNGYEVEQAPQAPLETFETVYGEDEKPIGQRSTTTGKMHPHPLGPKQPLVQMTGPVAETETQRVIGKGDGEFYNRLQTEAFSANEQWTTVREINSLLQDVSTGAFTGTITDLRKLGSRIGLELPDDVALVEAASSLSNRLALYFRNPESGLGLTGNTSQRDLEFLKSLPPGIGMTPEGREILGVLFERAASRKQQMASMADELRQQGRFTRPEFNRRWSEFLSNPENDLFADLHERVRAITGPETPMDAPVVPEQGSVSGLPADPSKLSDEELLRAIGINPNG